MANENTSQSRKGKSSYSGFNLFSSKHVRNTVQQIDNILGQANLTLYGTDRKSNVDDLNSKFQTILDNEKINLNNTENSEMTSFISQLWKNDRFNDSVTGEFDSEFFDVGGTGGTMESFLYDAYQNRLIEQADLHEVSSQLIELNEAINITRDAIISADIIKGRINRTLDFDSIEDDKKNNAKSVIEKLEERHSLLEKIKNFIIPKTLEYGEYYMYIIPYSKIFNNFLKNKDNIRGNGRYYKESTLLDNLESENVFMESGNGKVTKIKKIDSYLDDLYQKYTIQESTKYDPNKKYVNVDLKEQADNEKERRAEFNKDIRNIMGNISVCNEEVSIFDLEYGPRSIEEIKVIKEACESKKSSSFNKMIADASEGTIKDTDDIVGITDCYIKLIDPTKIIPIKIVDEIIGYYYVIDEDITPLSGIVSSSAYSNRFNDNSKEHTIIDSIANKIVDSFDKNFLKENIKFKKTIVDALNYYNINEKKIKFQFIPAEYIQEFKIDKDENGNGQSMVKKSLFYAKLYLMLLLFKIMSIVMNSNDQKVNYIKTSGLDKNLTNKVQELARKKQNRQININDLFNFTSMVGKVGKGVEMYVPTGRSGERLIETEILSGQDIQLNTELMETLKNSYILATGVPAAIVNYMNEADFAKVVEQNNSKFNGRVVNYQLDFNYYITEMYKKLMRWSTNIPDYMIENFKFTLQAPKTTNINTNNELISSFTQMIQFITELYFPEINNNDGSIDLTEINLTIKKLKVLMAKENLPMINFDLIEEMISKAKLGAHYDALTPNPNNGDEPDDDLEQLDEL